MNSASNGQSASAAGDRAGPQRPYPAAPWKLHGRALISAWRVPLADLPRQAPCDARVVTLGRHAICTTVWTAYEPGGSLAYNELLFATAVRRAGLLAPACTVGPIWVDDEAAAEGGRALWGIPKRIGQFEPLRAIGTSGRTAAMTPASLTADGQPVASLQFQPGLRIAVPLRFAVWTVQAGPAGPIRTRCTLRGMMRFGTAHWRIAESGPLGFLAGREPLASAWLDGMSVWFGV
jgi:hypothetical protein